MFYGILLVSGFWSSDSGQWLNLLRVNLPYAVLPLAFYLWPDFLWSKRRLFQRQFILAGAAITIYMIIYFIPNKETVMTIIRDGGPFPVPVNHVRTGLFLSLAGIFVWDEFAQWNSALKIERFLMSILLVFIIVGIHLLAVRTGILLFYAGTILTFSFNKNFHSRKGLWWGIAFLGVLAITIISFPTLHEKWAYFLEDVRNYNSTSWWFYSDALRWRTNVAGWEIFLGAPWWGVGMGDLFKEIHMWFYEFENVRIWEYPHNLWITILAGSGIAGFIILNLSLGCIFWQLWRKSTTVYLIAFILFLLSCLVENTLLTSLGCISFLFLMLMATSNDGTQDGEPHHEQN